SVGNGLNASFVQSPCGQFSFGKSGFVTPISFTYASPENCWSVGTCAFQPKRPTRVAPVATSVTLLGVPRAHGVLNASSLASVRNVPSGTASTRPSPNSGVVIRPARTLASVGTLSGAYVNTPAPAPISPIAWSWSSEPPSDSIGSNRPPTMRPNRVSTRPFVPPTGPVWQVTQDASLNTGPSPSSTSSSSMNSSRPASKRAREPASSPPSGPPSVVARAAVVNDVAPSSVASAVSAPTVSGATGVVDEAVRWVPQPASPRLASAINAPRSTDCARLTYAPRNASTAAPMQAPGF